jgi:hypothetical protein
MKKFLTVFLKEEQKTFNQQSFLVCLALKSIFQHFFVIPSFYWFNFEVIPLALSGQPISSSRIPIAH